jgi:predicted Ser/Thr protein kinase
MLVDYGYSRKVADELCKWYDFSEKKRVASY